MTNQAPTRSGDPQTSWDASKTVNTVKTKQLILETLTGLSEPVTAEQLTNMLREHGHFVSPSGVRSRLVELTRDMKVISVDSRGMTESGRRCQRYSINE